jgi:hypothetical protein
MFSGSCGFITSMVTKLIRIQYVCCYMCVHWGEARIKVLPLFHTPHNHYLFLIACRIGLEIKGLPVAMVIGSCTYCSSLRNDRKRWWIVFTCMPRYPQPCLTRWLPSMSPMENIVWCMKYNIIEDNELFHILKLNNTTIYFKSYEC